MLVNIICTFILVGILALVVLDHGMNSILIRSKLLKVTKKSNAAGE